MSADRSIPRAVCAIDRGMCWLGDHDLQILFWIIVGGIAGMVGLVNFGCIDVYLHGNGVEGGIPAGYPFVLVPPIAIDGFLLIVVGYHLIGVVWGDGWRDRCQASRGRKET